MGANDLTRVSLELRVYAFTQVHAVAVAMHELRAFTHASASIKMSRALLF